LLASAGLDGVVRLWDPELGRSIGPPLMHHGVVMMIAFDPAGRMLLSCSRDGKARLWPIPAVDSADAGRIALGTEMLTGKTLDAGGGVRFLDPDEWRQRRRAWEDAGR
jgi:WD40 repeat protein